MTEVMACGVALLALTSSRAASYLLTLIDRARRSEYIPMASLTDTVPIVSPPRGVIGIFLLATSSSQSFARFVGGACRCR